MSQLLKQPPELFYRKSFSEKFRNIYRKTPVLEPPFKGLAGFKTCNFLEKGLQHRCFPMNIAKFKTTYFDEKLRATASAVLTSYCQYFFWGVFFCS